jgi:hypothetical protein
MPACGRLGRVANALAPRNAAVRLPGGKPDEGELQVRFRERELETERPRRAICGSRVGALRNVTTMTWSGPSLSVRGHRSSSLFHRRKTSHDSC